MVVSVDSGAHTIVRLLSGRSWLLWGAGSRVWHKPKAELSSLSPVYIRGSGVLLVKWLGF